MTADPLRSASPRRSPTPARLLTIAGSDSGGGAGIQADLKTFAAHGVYGMSVLTAVTAQNTRHVTAITELTPAMVTAQMDAVFSDIGVDAVKIGMLSSPEIVRAVAEGLRRHRADKVVLDPVMVAKSGDALLQDEAVAALQDELIPLAHLITPNLPEAARLAGVSADALQEESQRRQVGEQLASLGAASSGPAVLMKGGHGDGDRVVDLLWDGAAWQRYEHPRQHVRATHGTGCTLSSAIAARWGGGAPLPQAVEGAIRYLQGAMAASFELGSGHGPVHHFWNVTPRA